MNPSANAQQGGSKRNISKPLLAAVFLAGLAAGTGAGYYFWAKDQSGAGEPLGKEVHQDDGRYAFTNPLLSCEIGGENVEYTELKPFRTELEKLVKSETDKGNAQNVSVYFRDLNNGPWFGVNHDETFTPGSLFKVPLLMAYLKIAESDPAVLKERVAYDWARDENAYQTFKPSAVLEKGQSYTVEELLSRTILYSDNNAAAVLVSHLKPDALLATYADLGIIVSGTQSIGDPVPVRRYASVFRILFNASYLSREFSEKALEVLSRTDFRDGIVAGVPKGVAVSHKFGERQFPGGEKQLHDCGIVYYPKHPYLLCVMSRGNNFTALTDGIQNISKAVWNRVRDNYR